MSSDDPNGTDIKMNDAGIANGDGPDEASRQFDDGHDADDDSRRGRRHGDESALAGGPDTRLNLDDEPSAKHGA